MREGRGTSQGDLFLFEQIKLLFTVFLYCLTVAKSENSTRHLSSAEVERLVLRTLAATGVMDDSVIDRNDVDLDRDIPKVCERMRTLDATLSAMGRNPPAGEGAKMMKLLQAYNQACLDLLFLSSHNTLKVLDMAQDILEPGGPQLFDITIDEKLMQERFQWDEDKMDDLNDVMKKTYEHWNDLWYINNNFPSDLGRLQS